MNKEEIDEYDLYKQLSSLFIDEFLTINPDEEDNINQFREELENKISFEIEDALSQVYINFFSNITPTLKQLKDNYYRQKNYEYEKKREEYRNSFKKEKTK